MTWTRAALCWLAALLLGIVVLASRPAEESGQPDLPAGQDVGAPAPVAGGVAGAPAPAAAPAPEPGYVIDSATLARVEVRRGDATVVLERGESGWKVAVPTDRVIPSGLVQAFVEQLVDSGRGERIGEIGDGGGDAAFGLAKPALTIDASGGGQQLRLAIGVRTPAGTAAYALVEEHGRVVLVGLNLLYYADLLLG